MKKYNIKKKEVIVIATKQMTRDIEIYLAENLKKKNKNLHIIFITSNVSKANILFYKKKYPGIFDEIIPEPDEFDCISRPVNKNNLFKDAKNIENWLGMSIYRLFFADRVIGVGFWASGGYHHPETKLRKNTDHIDIIKIAVTKAKFWKKILCQKNIKLAINLPHYAHIMAENLSLLSERLQGARFGNTQFWSKDLYLQPDNIEKTFVSLKNKKFSPIIIDKPYKAHTTFRKKHINNFKFSTTLRRSFYQLLKNIYGKIKGYRKSKNLYLLNEFIGSWRTRKQFLDLNKNININIKEAKNYNYIFFPLQTEPEIALVGVAQDFFFQLSAINLISRDLPADHRIIVKEHLYAVGRRPSNFYKQISSLKNVLIADPTDYGVDYVKNSKAVACITGTSAWEAVVMGIPVITFSKNNVFNFLEHAFYISNPDSTKEILPQVLNKSWPSKKSKIDGARFYNSYISNSFEIGEGHEFISWKVSNKQKDVLRKTAQLLANELVKKNKIHF